MIVAAAQLEDAPENLSGALAMLEHAVAQARGADLLVLPELALCGYGDPQRIRRMAVPMDGDFMAEVQALVRRARIGLIVGYAERADEVLYNSAIAIGADGAIRGHYRKVHLWGRYERDLFTCGSPAPIVVWGPLKLGLLICYDLEFPEVARDLVLRGADTLIVISATGRAYEVVPQHLVPSRGYETGCHVVYADWAGTDGDFAFAGLSCITAPNGLALATAPARGAAVIRAEVDAAAVAAWRVDHDYLADRRGDLYRWD